MLDLEELLGKEWWQLPIDKRIRMLTVVKLDDLTYPLAKFWQDSMLKARQATLVEVINLIRAAYPAEDTSVGLATMLEDELQSLLDRD